MKRYEDIVAYWNEDADEAVIETAKEIADGILAGLTEAAAVMALAGLAYVGGKRI